MLALRLTWSAEIDIEARVQSTSLVVVVHGIGGKPQFRGDYL